jgi:hypothetical protein
MTTQTPRRKNLEASLLAFHRKITGNYTGEYKNGRPEDPNGRYVFPNGSIYDGGFVDGEYVEFVFLQLSLCSRISSKSSLSRFELILADSMGLADCSFREKGPSTVCGNEDARFRFVSLSFVINESFEVSLNLQICCVDFHLPSGSLCLCRWPRIPRRSMEVLSRR